MTIPSTDMQSAHRLLIQASEQGRIDEVVRLLQIVPLHAGACEAFERAVAFGRGDVVKFLKPLVGGVFIESMLSYAAQRGQAEIVALLLSYETPKCTQALQRAVERGDVEIVRLLFRHVDLRDEDNLALTLAAGAGNMEIVELLLPVANPRARNSQAVRVAVRKGHAKVVKRLIPVSDCGAVLELLRQHTQYADFFKHCLREYVAEQQHHRLMQVVHTDTTVEQPTSLARKM